MYKVLVADEISPEGLTILQESLTVDYEPQISSEELLAKINDYHGLLVRSRTIVSESVIRHGKNLKVIGRAGVGVDNIDVGSATEHGIVVLNSPEGNTASAAEHTIALMMALVRMIPSADHSVKEGKWERNRFIGCELFNKTLGIIGLGKVGGRVAQTALSLGMKVIIHDPLVTIEKANSLQVQKVSLDELWSRSDFISFHTPKTPETTNMLNENVIPKLKTSVRIINVSRGGVINEKVLAQAIKDNRIAGAALDVYTKEPPSNSPLLALADKVILTPHLGASTSEAQLNVALDLAEQMRDYLHSGMAKSPVNLPYMKPEILKQLGRYVWLSEAMARIASELSTGDVQSLEIILRGKLVQKDDAPLTVAALRGLLLKHMEGVTYVNAPLIARNKGIGVRASKSEEAVQFSEELTVAISTVDRTISLTGTVLTHNEPMITQINVQPISLYPVPMMLFTSHRDQPGIVAQVAGVLAQHDINISNMSVARSSVRGEAVMVMGIDDPLSPKIIGELNALAGVNNAHFVCLPSMSPLE